MKMGRLQLAPAPSTVPAPSAATVPALIHVFNDIPAPSPVWWEWCGWDNPYELRRNGLWHQLAPVGSAGVAPLTVPVGLLLLLWCRRLQPAPGPNQPSVVPVPPATKVVPVRAPTTVTPPPRHQFCEKRWSAPKCQIWCHAVKTAPEWIWICDSWWWQGECNLPSLGCKTAKVVFACSTLWKSDTSAANPVTEWVLLFRGFASLNLSGTCGCNLIANCESDRVHQWRRPSVFAVKRIFQRKSSSALNCGKVESLQQLHQHEFSFNRERCFYTWQCPV